MSWRAAALTGGFQRFSARAFSWSRRGSAHADQRTVQAAERSRAAVISWSRAAGSALAATIQAAATAEAVAWWGALISTRAPSATSAWAARTQAPTAAGHQVGPVPQSKDLWGHSALADGGEDGSCSDEPGPGAQVVGHSIGTSSHKTPGITHNDLIHLHSGCWRSTH